MAASSTEAPLFVVRSVLHRHALVVRASLLATGSFTAFAACLWLALSGANFTVLFAALALLAVTTFALWWFSIRRHTFDPSVRALAPLVRRLREGGMSERKTYVITIGVAATCGAVVAAIAMAALAVRVLAVTGSTDALLDWPMRITASATFALATTSFRMAALRPAEALAFAAAPGAVSRGVRTFDALGLSTAYDLVNERRPRAQNSATCSARAEWREVDVAALRRPAVNDPHRIVSEGDAVVISQLTKQFSDRVAVKELTFAIPQGSICGLVGPNGAGKTTLMRMLLGLEAPTAGEAWVLGADIKRPQDYLARVGAVIEGPVFYPNLTVEQNLLILCKIGGIPMARIDRVLQQVDLAARSGDRYRSLSLGMKQRVGLAAALLPDPSLLILDEPTNGLDPRGIRELLAFLRSQAQQGMTVIISSHQLADLQEISDQVVVLDEGRALYSGSIRGMSGCGEGGSLQTVIRATPEGEADLDALEALVRSLGFDSRRHAEAIEVRAPDSFAGELNRLAMSHGITLKGLTSELPSLTTAFLNMTQRSA